MSRLPGLLREPLLHFFVLGALLFFLFDISRDPVERSADRIVVSEGVIEQLAAQFSRTWLRPPTQAELEGLIEGHVREEVYYREALALGLERNDRIVRQRMRQKLEFLLEDLSPAEAPTDAELSAFLAESGERFRIPTRVSFRHVYLNPDEREDPDADAAALLNDLRGGAAPEDLGDPFMLGYAFEAVTSHDIARAFGKSFAEQVVALEAGEWQGPLASGLGQHLVLVDAREVGRLPALEDVRARVEQEWLAKRRHEQKDAAYRRLREGYEVVIDGVWETGALEAEVSTR